MVCRQKVVMAHQNANSTNIITKALTIVEFLALAFTINKIFIQKFKNQLAFSKLLIVLDPATWSLLKSETRISNQILSGL